MKRRAFTLIELLVVVAIFAVLTGLILPTLMRVGEGTRRTVCLSNVQRINKACRFYAQDNQGWLPRELRPDIGDSFTAPTFQFDAAAYWGSRGYRADVQYGSGDKDPREKEPWYKTGGCPSFKLGKRAIEEWGMSIGTNTRYTAVVPDAWNSYRNLHFVKHLTSIILVVENVYACQPENFWEDIKPVCRGRMIDDSAEFDKRDEDNVRNYPRHRQEGLNFGFMDGHGTFREYEIEYNDARNIVRENFLPQDPFYTE